MRKRMCFIIGIIVSYVAVTGCATKRIALDPSLTYYSRESLKNCEIKLPNNYNKENYRKLQLGVAFNAQGKKPGEISPEIVQTLSSRLQTEMAKLKRFTVFSAHNRGGVQFFQSLADVGDAKMLESTDMKALDLILSASITLSKEKHERDNDDLIIYEVECDFNCEDVKSRQVKFAEKSTGRTARSMKISLTGKKMGGFNEADETQALFNASMKAISVASNKLGNYYPVGGRITAMLGERLTLDKGFEHGITKDMQMVLYTTISGVDVPLAIAEASPGTTTSNLTLWRWNEDDKYAYQIKKDIEKDSKWLDKNELYAVSYGMGTPPEWENAYKDSYDESMRAK